MTTATDHDQLQKLLSEAPWLRRLAQRLGGIEKRAASKIRIRRRSASSHR